MTSVFVRLLLAFSVIGFSIPFICSQAATLSWSGASPVSGNWSDSQNWGFAGTPANGDILIFPAAQPRLANTNDIASLTISQIRFVGGGGGYAIRGNAFTLTNGIAATNTAGINVLYHNITLTDTNQLINVGSGASLTLAGVLSGSAGVTKSGLGTLAYSGPSPNTYLGMTVALEGMLDIGNSGAGFGRGIPGDLQVGDATHSATVRWLLDNQIPNDATVTAYSGSVLNLNNFLDDLGSLNLYAATVNMGTGYLDFRAPNTITMFDSTGAATINGRIGLASGNVTVDVQDTSNPALNVNASIGNSGGLIKTGPGGLSLNSSNGYEGLTVVQQGLLWIKAPTGLGNSSSGTVVSNGASLVLQGSFGVTNEALTLNGFGESSLWGAFDSEGNNTNFWTGPITLNATSTIAPYVSGSVLRISGVISGPGGFILGTETGNGSGILYLEGALADTYAGTTTVRGGTLLLGKPSTTKAVPGMLVIETGRTVRLLNSFQIYDPATQVTMSDSSLFDLAGFNEWVGPINMQGAQITSGAGILYFSGDITVNSSTVAQSVISGNAEIWAGTYTITNVGHNYSPDLWISANVSSGGGAGGLIKTGNGEVSLAGNNTFTGPVTVNGGTLWAVSSTAFGNTITNATVNSGGSIFLYGSVAIGAKPLVLSGPGHAFGALSSAFGVSSWSGTVTLASNSTISVNGASDFLTLNNVVSGPGALTKAGPGTLTLGGSVANSYAGTTIVNTGTLVLSKSFSVPAVPGNLVINNGATVRLGNDEQTAETTDVLVNGGGLFDFSTYYTYFDELSGAGTVNFGVAGWIWLGLNDGSSTFDGLFTGTGYAPGWTVGKTGTGTFTMNGNNTYSAGNIEIQGGGTMVINGAHPRPPVILDSTSTLSGYGTVGTIATTSGNISPGTSPGILTCSNLAFTAAGDYFVELTGPTPGTNYDQLSVRGTNSLAGATLHVSANFTTAVGAGSEFNIINNDGSDAIVGTFGGLPQGATIATGFHTFTISYTGGTGNDVVLTLTSVPIAQAGTAVTSGNGNHVIDPNECNNLSLIISNKTGTPMTDITATLSVLTPHVLVPQPASAYPNVSANGQGTNVTAFQISTTPAFACGTDIRLELTVATSSHGAFSIPVFLPSGLPGTVPVRYDVGLVTNIPDIGTIESTNTVVAFGGPITKVAVSLWLTHALGADLNISLISPDGVTVDLSSGNGGGANFGIACAPDSSRTTFDDAAGTSITAGASPFTGTFRPEASLAGFIGGTPNGNWRLRVTDNFGGSLGALRCWSLFLYGPECTEGQGFCESCLGFVTNSISSGDLTNANRLARNGLPGTCAAPLPCGGEYSTTGPYHYDTHVFTNSGGPGCMTVTLDTSCDDALSASAYLGSFNPSNLCANFLGEMGNIPSRMTDSFTVNVPGGTNFVIVVNEIYAGSGCAYTLLLSSDDCVPTLVAEPSGAPETVRVHWPTWAGGYNLEATTNVSAATWLNVTNEPIVSGGRYNVTNQPPPANHFYRLNKPLP